MTAEWWMVWITFGSVVVTGFLAWLAYANGRKATTIASEAAEREELHRERELAQREREERSRVAMAMMRAVSAAEQFADLNTPHYEISGEVESEMVRKRTEALAQVELYATTEEDAELRVWIEGALNAVAYPEAPLNSHLDWGHGYFVRRGIRLWNLGEVTSGQLCVGDLPPEASHGEGDKAPVSSA